MDGIWHGCILPNLRCNCFCTGSSASCCCCLLFFIIFPQCVKDATGVFWLADLGYLPFLLSSPATAMLRAYFPDGVGVSPVGVWKWSGIRSRPVPTPAQRSTTEVKAEFCSSTSDTGTCSTSSVGSASSAQPVLTTTAPTIPPPQAAGTGLASTLVIKKPIQSSPRRPTSSYRPSRRHLGKHGGPGRAKAKQQNDDDSSDGTLLCCCLVLLERKGSNIYGACTFVACGEHLWSSDLVLYIVWEGVENGFLFC